MSQRGGAGHGNAGRPTAVAATQKLVLVTGAGRGIGREIALRLAADGFAVAGCARTTNELGETSRLSGHEMRMSEVDVRSPESVERWIHNELSKPGVVPWGLVTAAGIHGAIGPFLEANWDEWKLGIDVNLYGTALACKFFAAHMVKHRLHGRIALLSGGGATQPIENLTSYCASKAAVVRFGETLAQELKAHGITVNAIAPGAVNTAITQTIIDAGPEKAGRALYDKSVRQLKEGGAPAGKAAALASYLMSDDSAPVTGKLISAVWDDWANFHKNAHVENKDNYTLRRLVPPEEQPK